VVEATAAAADRDAAAGTYELLLALPAPIRPEPGLSLATKSA